MTEQQLTDELYKIIADKTLSFWCLIEIWWENKDICTWKCWENAIFWNNYKVIDKWWISNIIWHTISLSRVLSILGYSYYYFDDEIKRHYGEWLKDNIICERELTKDDWSEAYLDDQSFETKLAIYDLVNNK